MSQIKQSFDEKINSLRYDKGLKIKEIALKSGIDHARLTNIVNNRTRPNEHDLQKIQILHEGLDTPTPNSMAQDLKEIKEMVKSQSEMVKQQYETITTKGKDIIDATIKAIAQKHNMSIEEVMVSFEKMLVERLKEDQNETK